MIESEGKLLQLVEGREKRGNTEAEEGMGKKAETLKLGGGGVCMGC